MDITQYIIIMKFFTRLFYHITFFIDSQDMAIGVTGTADANTVTAPVATLTAGSEAIMTNTY